MALVIEGMDESGPLGLPAISVAHYGEQNGDLLRDPEICFELGTGGGAHLNPFYYRNDYVGVEQWSRNVVRDHYVHLVELHKQHQDMGQQPAFAGIRRGLRATAQEPPLAFSVPSRSGNRYRAAASQTPNPNPKPTGGHHAEQQRISVHRHRHHP